jgi:parallel beta helix pectate lyase-like protein
VTSSPAARALGALLAACVAGTAGAAPAAIYVDVANHSGTENGTPAFPFDTIQEGIAAAAQGDRVLVAAGVYLEALLMADGVSVIGAGAASTILDATGKQASAVTFDATRLAPELSGFTIRGGTGDLLGEIGGEPIRVAGGILIVNSSPLIHDNRIVDNRVTQGHCLGGGIYVEGQESRPTILRNVIARNVAASSTIPGGSGRGGGMYVSLKNAGITIEGNLVADNVSIEGGGVWIDNEASAAVLFARNRLERNRAAYGGALRLQDSAGSHSDVRNNLFVDNGSTAPGAAGGGIAARAAGTGSFRIVNNTFAGCSVPQGRGAGVMLDDTLATTTASLVANNVFVGNAAAAGGGIDHTDFGGTIRSNDFHSNVGGDLYDAGGSSATLVGNLFVDPQLAGTLENPYRPAPGSPLIDAASQADAPADDRDAFARPYDGDGDAIPRSDVGAHEFPAHEIQGLGFAGTHRVVWDTLVPQETYNLYRGSLDRLRLTGVYTQDPALEPLAGRFCGVLPAEVPFEDLLVPPPGKAVFYLATQVLGAWESGLGDDGDGLPRPAPNGCD